MSEQMKKANTQKVRFQSPYGGQLTLSTQLIILNYPVILFHQSTTTVSLETYPLQELIDLHSIIDSITFIDIVKALGIVCICLGTMEEIWLRKEG